MGRKPNQLISTHFRRGQKLENSSNRYEQTCIHCARTFPKGRPEVLTSHLSKCPALSPATRINILNQPEATQQASASEPDQNYDQQHNVGLRQLADVAAEQAGASSLRISLPNDHAIPLDPQLNTPNHHHQNGNSLVVPQFGDHNYYAPAAPYTANDHSIHAGSSSSVYPSLGGSAVGPETNHYPTFPTAAATTFSNIFGQYTTSVPIPNALTNTLPPNGAGVEFDAFDHTSAMGVPNMLPQVNAMGPIDPAFTQQAAEIASQQQQPSTPSQQQHNVAPVRSASRPRKAKEPYSADQRKKIADVRRVRPCVRCSRLQKSCSMNKPCGECGRVKTSKNWIGGCTKFSNSTEFDVWYEPSIADELGDLLQQVERQNTIDTTVGFLIEIRHDAITAPPITFEVMRSLSPDGQDVVWIPHAAFDLQFTLNDYLQENIEQIIQAIPEPELQITLGRALDLTKGTKVALTRVVPGADLQGDDNMRQLISLWLAAYLLSSPPFSMTILDPSGNPLVGESEESFLCLNLKLNTCLESMIASSRTGPTPAKDVSDEPEYGGPIYDFDITRISSSGHKEFHNLLLGIIVVLSAVERYCAWTRARTGSLPEAYRVKAEEYARKYIYAVRGISILPQLEIQQDAAGDQYVVANRDLVTTTTNTGGRTLDYTLTRAYITSLRLHLETLQTRSVSVDSWDGNVASWDGWLWSRVFLAMLE